MKKCPTCDRSFEDAMRFCQADGTALVDDAPPVDPYKTMVASQEEIAAAIPVAAETPKQEDEVLQLPAEADPKKTMYASEEEIRKEMAARDEPVVELPPLAPEPPKFTEPSLSPPSFGDVSPAAPPPSPLGSSSSEPQSELTGDPFQKTTPPIPSPFDTPRPAAYDQPTAFAPPDREAVAGIPVAASMEPAPVEAAAPMQNLEQNEPMQNPPVSASGPQGQSKTLAILSLVSGVLGLLCCGILIPSLVAIILGVVARGKASNDPANYGGSGLAVAGILTGVFGLLGGIAYLVWLFLLGGLETLMRMQGVQ